MRIIPGSVAAVNETVAVTLMRASRENALEAYRRMVTLIGSIGTVATTLAAAGMFALVAFTVAQRKRELGIRMALGAGPRQILDVLVRQNAVPMVAGAVTGVILAVILSRVVRSQIVLQRQDTVDVVGFAAGLACFTLVAVLASCRLPYVHCASILPRRYARNRPPAIESLLRIEEVCKTYGSTRAV